MVERATAAKARFYETTSGIRDRHKDDPPPEQIDEVARWFTCLGTYRDSAAEAAKAKAFAKELRDKAAERERCDGDPACRVKREAEERKAEAQELADEICSQMAERAETKRQIASEHRYSRAAGVVSLRDLQDLKETLRFLDERIAEKSAAYRAGTGKKFSAKACR